MKESRYNFILSKGQYRIMYNCRTDVLMVLNETLAEIWDNFAQKSFEGLAKKHPDFYDRLIKGQFIIQETIDEAASFQQELRMNHKASKQFSIYINPTMDCNMRCWYCYERHKPNSRMRENVISSIGRLIQSKLASGNIETISLSFFGGEPLLHFKDVVVPIIRQSQELCNQSGKKLTIGFTSNGYLISQEIIQELKVVEIDAPISWQIAIDGGASVHNQVKRTIEGSNSYERTVKNIEALILAGMKVLVRLNYQEKNILSFLDVLDDFRLIKPRYQGQLEFQIQRIWQDTGIRGNQGTNASSVQKVKDVFARYGLSLIDSRYEPKRCYADGEDSIVINFDGNLYNCTAQDFTSDLSEGILRADGELIMNDRHEYRRQRLYDNETCLNCRIYPFCFGGCSQQQMVGTEKNICIRNWDEQEKENVITRRIMYLLSTLNQNNHIKP